MSQTEDALGIHRVRGDSPFGRAWVLGGRSDVTTALTEDSFGRGTSDAGGAGADLGGWGGDGTVSREVFGPNEHTRAHTRGGRHGHPESRPRIIINRHPDRRVLVDCVLIRESVDGATFVRPGILFLWPRGRTE